MTTCPKCGYTRQPRDRFVLEGTCPACGIAYNKYKAVRQNTQQAGREVSGDFKVRAQETFNKKLAQQFLYVPDQVDELSFWARAVLAALFALWGASFIIGGIDWESIGGSFLHNVNLPFHEFGHVLFIPLGRFMAILGGSLFQILLPLIFLVAFTIKRDNFAASIMLWWCGQNFIDVSPYIQDAPYRSLPLISGMGEEAHDWGNLLTMTGSLDKADTLAGVSFTLGSLLIIGAMIWAGVLLWKMKQVKF